MRVIIAGSRSVTDYHIVEQAVIDSGFVIDTVISGGALGVDSLGIRWAVLNMVPVEIYMADWEAHGRAAGHIRNELMAGIAESLIAVHKGDSPGTRSMIEKAKNHGLLIHTMKVEG